MCAAQEKKRMEVNIMLLGKIEAHGVRMTSDMLYTWLANELT